MKETTFLGRLRSWYSFRILPRVKDLPGAFQVNKFLGLLNDFVVDRPEGEVFSPYERDWDVLIILDACRYDFYSEFFPEAGKRVSRASHSREYFGENYSDGDFSDVVYVSANGHLSPSNFEEATGRELDGVFYRVEHLTLDAWDDDLGVVPPEKVTDSAIQMEKRFPGKRKVIHFMQPHKPYIDTEGDWAFEEVWKGEKRFEDLKQAYRDNIEVVLPEIERIKENLDGKIVVTADHGELLGEYGLYGHLYGLNAAELREVPWHVVKDGEKSIESEDIEELDI